MKKPVVFQAVQFNGTKEHAQELGLTWQDDHWGFYRGVRWKVKKGDYISFDSSGMQHWTKDVFEKEFVSAPPIETHDRYNIPAA